jgi:hypothetical protein
MIDKITMIACASDTSKVKVKAKATDCHARLLSNCLTQPKVEGLAGYLLF